jgi:hypothetical protein
MTYRAQHKPGVRFGKFCMFEWNILGALPVLGIFVLGMKLKAALGQRR